MKFLVSTLVLIGLLYLAIFTFGTEGSEANEDNMNAAKNSTKSGNAVSFAFCSFFLRFVTCQSTEIKFLLNFY